MLSLTQKLSIETRTKVARIIVLWIIQKEYLTFFPVFSTNSIVKIKEISIDFFFLAVFEKTIVFFSSHMWLWIDNHKLIVSAMCGKIRFSKDIIISSNHRESKKKCPSHFFSGFVVIMRHNISCRLTSINRNFHWKELITIDSRWQPSLNSI